MSNWRERLSFWSSSFRDSLAWFELKILLFTRCSISVILELLSAKAFSSLSSIAVSRISILLVKSGAISEIFFCVSELRNDILSSSCCSFSEELVSWGFAGFALPVVASLVSKILGFLSAKSISWGFSWMLFPVEPLSESLKMRSRIALIRSLVSSGVAILRSLFFVSRAKNMPC